MQGLPVATSGLTVIRSNRMENTPSNDTPRALQLHALQLAVKGLALDA